MSALPSSLFSTPWADQGKELGPILPPSGHQPHRLRRLARWTKLGSMSTVEEVEDAVRRLSPKELAVFRAWFAELDAAAWDRQIEEDVAAGRLDALADEALNDLREGRCTDR